MLTLLSVFILTSTVYSTVLNSSPTVTIGNSVFIGRRTSNDVDFFGGLPFAEPPVGNLRLRPPVLKSFLGNAQSNNQNLGHPETFNATNFGPSCIQTMLPADQISEDCLTLNIYRPSSINSEILNGNAPGLPVMLWIYGGGFIVGSASMYDGTPLVARSVSRGTPTIFVSVNYRLGPLGFPRGEDADREAKAGSPILNLGLKDNLAALQWIKENIAFFGGDPTKVTVFGESAGALAIELLILNGEIRGLARGAILESTAAVPFASPANPTANDVWNNVIAAIPKCRKTSQNTVECIRSLTTSELIEAFNDAHLFFNNSGGGVWSPVLDGELVPGFPSTLKPGHGVVQAVIVGSTKDEATLFTPQTGDFLQIIRERILSSPPSPPDASPAERKAQLKQLERIVQETLNLYPNIPSLGSPFDTGNNTFGLDPGYKRAAAVSSDFLFQAGRRLLVNRKFPPAGISIFTYLFADPDAVPVQDFVTGTPAPGSLGVTHSSEIFYVFGVLGMRPEVGEVTPTAAKLSQNMMDYWISFTNVLNPNDGAGSSRPLWPEYVAENQMVMQLDGHNTTAIPDDFRREQIDLFIRDSTVLGH